MTLHALSQFVARAFVISRQPSRRKKIAPAATLSRWARRLVAASTDSGQSGDQGAIRGAERRRELVFIPPRTEGQKGGEFYMPSSIVKLLTEIIEPFHAVAFENPS